MGVKKQDMQMLLDLIEKDVLQKFIKWEKLQKDIMPLSHEKGVLFEILGMQIIIMEQE